MAVKKATSATARGAQAKRTTPTTAGAKIASTTAPTAPTARATTTAEKAATKPPAGAGSQTATSKTPGKVARPTRKEAATTQKSTAKTAKATTAPTSKVAATKAPASGAGAASPRLRVRDNEKPWTVKELAGVRAELESDIFRLQGEISAAEVDLAGLMRDAGDGAGDDQADAGTATLEREQEISLANNAREMCDQSRRALARIAGGTYGLCESCGSPIGKNRLLAFPRATLCLTCKSKQERR